MDEATKLGFTFARDLSYHLITLSTGIIALTITFLKDITKGVPTKWSWMLRLSWLLLLASVLFGILTTMALTGTLFTDAPKKTIEMNVRVPAGIQIVLFGTGTVLVICYSWKSLQHPGTASASAELEPTEAAVIRKNRAQPPAPSDTPG